MEIISYIFSYVKNKLTWFDVQLLIVCIMIFSYYLVCGLLVVNSMPNLVFKDKLHRYLYPGFDFENLHWYYDCPYVIAASFFIMKETSENIPPKIEPNKCTVNAPPTSIIFSFCLNNT